MADLSAPVLSTMEMVDYCLEKLLDAKVGRVTHCMGMLAVDYGRRGGAW